MILDEVFESFIAKSPFVVMFRVLLERSLSAQAVDQLFAENAQKQYQKELLFSTVVSLMSAVVCGIAKSVNSAYQSNAKQVGVTISAVYQKLDGIEPQVCEALVRYSAAQASALITQLGMARPALVPGYRTKILDGNHLSATERRLAVLHSVGSAPLPAQALVVLDPSLALASDMFGCEDGHAQERALIPQVLKTVKPKDLWLEDRNFCTLGFLFGIHVRGAFFAVRQHAKLPWSALGELTPVGTSKTGEVLEQSVQLVFNDCLKMVLRRIVVQLLEPTRDGHTELAILSTLPADVSGVEIAELYHQRWSIERLFQVLKQCFEGEINTLAYPGAALFGFSMALVCYNILAVLRAAMGNVHGPDKIEAGISSYYLTDEIRRVYDGMMIAIPPQKWEALEALDLEQTAELLKDLAAQMDLAKYQSHPRGKKKKKAKPKRQKNKPHVSTARLLAQAREAKKKTDNSS
ncbi:MAG: transposase [Cyanobacteria bacterium P01_F01_bin.150]